MECRTNEINYIRHPDFDGQDAYTYEEQYDHFRDKCEEILQTFEHHIPKHEIYYDMDKNADITNLTFCEHQLSKVYWLAVDGYQYNFHEELDKILIDRFPYHALVSLQHHFAKK